MPSYMQLLKGGFHGKSQNSLIFILMFVTAHMHATNKQDLYFKSLTQ